MILNQARVHDFYLDAMRKSPSQLEPDYWCSFDGLSIAPEKDYPVTVTLKRTGDMGREQTEVVKARYVIGTDGARSKVRRALGYALKGDSANQAWGVMDVLAVTDFPDIRLKATVLSRDQGSVLIIPREGGYLVRVYVELDELEANERVERHNITLDRLIAAAQRILHPFSLEVKECVWWSVYEIGQRICDNYADAPQGAARAPCVFIAGDACHTHSPKAGQGMNVSMQDSFNLGWKIAAVLRGLSPPKLLETYSEERRAIAQELLDFDREQVADAPETGVAEGVELTGLVDEGPRFRRRALGDDHDRGVVTTCVAAGQVLADHVDVERLFRDEDLRRAAGDARIHRDPAGVPPHDLAHDHAVV